MIDARLRNHVVLSTAILSVLLSQAGADDWPMWRFDASRSAATPTELPATLELTWRREFPPLTPAWEEDPRLHFDGGYEPIAAGGLLYVASSQDDVLIAIDVDSGEERWRYYAGGPIRFAPVSVEGAVFFGADDGCIHCVDAQSGQRIWKFLAAPDQRKVLGNARMISVWPVRGGPVLHEERIWLTVGVWPFEGTFLYSFDVAGATSEEIRQTSQQAEVVSLRDSGLPGLEVETLTDITPQGYLVGARSRLFIPCGRSKVLLKDLATGDFTVPSYSTGDSSSYHVCATDRILFHGGISVDLQESRTISLGARHPVFDSESVYFGKGGAGVACDLAHPREVTGKDRRGREVTSTQLDQLWRLRDRDIHDVPGEAEYAQWLQQNPLRVDLKAGNRLYGHQGNRLFAVEIPDGEKPATAIWNRQIDGTPRSMIAADDHLFVVTEEGTILCFGAEGRPDRLFAREAEPLEADPAWSERAAAILEESDVHNGYCLAVGIGTGGLVRELARQSDLEIVVIDSDPQAVSRLRSELDRSGLYGTRVSVIVGDPVTAALPPYFASLVVSEGLETGDIKLSDELVRAVFQATRPYGGVSILPLADDRTEELQEIVARLGLAGADVRRVGEFTRLTRVGRLPGSADWTHEYGDPSNTLMSHDELVKAPLGVLWFGGPAASGDLFYNRHFWGPSAVVIGGRMFIQGPGDLAAIDVYTGRILWQQSLEDVDNYRPGRRGNDFEGRLAGFHFLAVEDSLYLVLVDRCVRLDPETGEELAAFRLENPEEQWGRIRVEEDLLITEVFGETAEYGVMPVGMAALDRYTGELRWRHDAQLSFPVSAVSGDTLYCFDGALEEFYKDARRRGRVPEAAENKSVVAIDLATGEERWRVETDQVFTWLAFSREQDTLIASNKLSITAFAGADGYQLWTRAAEGVGFRGHPETLWDKVILWNDQILDQRGPGRAWEVLTGKPIERMHPITQELVDWEFTKSGHHCNYAIANPYLMTFRADTAGFCDIASSTTSRLQGYRPGCRNSLIPANGVLNSPNFANGCVCGYPLFTSLALIHRPDAEVWSYNAITMPKEKKPVERLAVNFGAPGDRQDQDGSLWLDYPNRGGSSPDVGLRVEGEQLRYFHQHSTLVEADEMSWVAASGVEGVSRITVALNNPSPREYTLRLVFSESDAGIDQSDRVFNVVVQGEPRISALDIFQEADGRNQGLVREVPGVSAASDLSIEFVSVHGEPVLCGFELVAVSGTDEGDD